MAMTTLPTSGPIEAHVADRKSYGKLPHILEVPNLIDIQLTSFNRFRKEGLRELFDYISPIQDLTGSRLELHFLDYHFHDAKHECEWDTSHDPPRCTREVPKHPAEECRQRDTTFAVPLYATVRLVIKETGEFQESLLFIADFPVMTPQGTFIINGAERVVVSQLLRSPGAYFTLEEDASSGRDLCYAKLIPDRGAWLEFEVSNKNTITVKVDGKRKIPITNLLRAISDEAHPYGSDEQLLDLFEDMDEGSFIKTTIEREPLIRNREEALLDIYKRLRPGDPPNVDNARNLLVNLLFNSRRYDLGRVGRHKINKRLRLYQKLAQGVSDLMAVTKLGKNLEPARQELDRWAARNNERVLAALQAVGQALEADKGGRKAEPVAKLVAEASSRLQSRVLTPEDLLDIVRHVILVNSSNQEDSRFFGKVHPDDIDHLGNRRVRTVGELIQNQLRIGLLRLERVVKERMSITDPKTANPAALINIRPVVAALREFFGGSQLSQFMDQTNPLAELTHKRRLSALGPGGLSRERAGFDVRDVHHSHYGRICPIETPEGPNIGLIGSLASYSRVNEFGFIETPYLRVVHQLPSHNAKLVGKTPLETVKGPDGEILARAKKPITAKVGKTLADLPEVDIPIVPFVSLDLDDIEWLAADQEEEHTVAQANSTLDEEGQFQSHFIEEKVEVRRGNKYFWETSDKIDFMDVSPKQIVSVATALIPFLEHNDANRALMGSNMQRQAVPLLCPEAPIVGTGIERQAARDSGQVLFAQEDGEVVSVTGSQIEVRGNGGQESPPYSLMKFVRTNQGTCINQRPLVRKGDRVRKGQIMADSSATENGELALGQNVLCAFMIWEGYNFEDAVIVSEELVERDKFTSIHIEKHELEARETKLGPEEITRDIPNVGEESLRDLDEEGIIRIGAEVGPGDILVGKITPKGETELSAEEKLLRAIFGEKARDVKDTSLRVPHGERGKVIDVKIFSRDNRDELQAGVTKLVRVWLAQKRKVSVGDKLAGRHGNKGVIARILPVEDMPYLPDGRPVQIILNPIGVPSRMNIGQILETHLAGAAHSLNQQVLCPVFDGATSVDIEDAMARVWILQKARAINPAPEREGGAFDGEQAKEWLAERGYDGDRIFSDEHTGEAREACLRLWLGDMGVESHDIPAQELDPAVENVYKEKRVPPPVFGKILLRDGRTGEPFDQPVAVGYIYTMKLIHLVEDKIHARSTGPYSLITQQPLGGKAQFGGQRFGEMEVWALEAYGAAHILQELLTVKSDDVRGRAKTYEAIVKSEDIMQPGVPESFKVLVKELQSLGLSVEVLNEAEEGISFADEDPPDIHHLGLNLSFERTDNDAGD